MTDAFWYTGIIINSYVNVENVLVLVFCLKQNKSDSGGSTAQ